MVCMRPLLSRLKPLVPLQLGGRCLVGVLALSYAWVLLMPVVPSVLGAGIMRFNLLTDSFGSWALLQTIPSMYNFSNQADFGPVHLEPRLPYLQMNHYPSRLFTFSERDDHTEALPMILKTRSAYQGNQIEAYHLIEEAPGGMKMTSMLHSESDD
jgi:hypothetical protein